VSIVDILIKSGKVVSEGSVLEADIAIKDGRIAAILQPDLITEAKRTIDAAGKLVIPGVVDPHFHCRTIGSFHSILADDMETATVSAAHGGVTTVLVYVWGDRGQPFQHAMNTFLEESPSKVLLDYAAHCGVRPDFDLIKSIPQVLEMGVRSFKFIMDYRRTGDGRMAEADHMMAAMELIGRGGGIALCHAEDGYLIDYLENKFISEGKTAAKHFIETRPTITEARATRDCVEIGRLAGCPVYVVHVTAKEALQEVIAAQAHHQVVIGETCPQYLALTNEEVLRQGALAKIGPPLRSQEDIEELWGGIATGAISTIGSDHAAMTVETKRKVEENFFEVPFGMPSVETMLSVMYSEGVAKGRISLVRLVELLCENPARRFGLYPKKGTLKVGSDADVVIFDPGHEWTISGEKLHGAYDYTCFEGWRCKGKPILSLLRGHVLLENGKLHQGPGFGRFIEQDRIDHNRL
jgi:dihydropyrimidinase